MSLKKIKLFMATLAIAASLSLNSTPAITLTYSAAGSAGSPTLNIEPTTVVPKPDSHGSFRIVCRYSHANYDDAILKPGQAGASHLHIYFGNTKTNAYTIYSSLSTSGNGTCHGGIANRSSYWIPAMIDTAKNEVKIPRDFIVYYKSYAPDTVVKPPNGIKLLVGNPMATAPQGIHIAQWACTTNTSPSQTIYSGSKMPVCAKGNFV